MTRHAHAGNTALRHWHQHVVAASAADTGRGRAYNCDQGDRHCGAK